MRGRSGGGKEGEGEGGGGVPRAGMASKWRAPGGRSCRRGWGRRPRPTPLRATVSPALLTRHGARTRARGRTRRAAYDAARSACAPYRRAGASQPSKRRQRSRASRRDPRFPPAIDGWVNRGAWANTHARRPAARREGRASARRRRGAAARGARGSALACDRRPALATCVRSLSSSIRRSKLTRGTCNARGGRARPPLSAARACRAGAEAGGGVALARAPTRRPRAPGTRHAHRA